jgi:hypothetical protein
VQSIAVREGALVKLTKPSPSEARLARLVAQGYFPSELPPSFSTKDYGKHANAFAKKWDGQKIRSYWTAAERYSIPRYGHARRSLSIVNPVNQLHVSQLISENWQEIQNRLKRSTATEFKPDIIKSGNTRAVSGVDFDGVARRRSEILGTYGRYLKTDIARFYSSIYTHAIPWAIYSKQHCKANHKDAAFKATFGNQLDKAVGAGQDGQTIGIPIGPDTSRIISELIAVEIEELAKVQIPDWNERCVRYVDDIIIGINDDETPSSVLSSLSMALYDYELELNAEKTATIGIGHPHAPEWGHYIRTFELGSGSRQREDIDSFFEQAFYLADANKRDNVLLFAVKRAAGFYVEDENIDHVVRWMLYAARRSTSCLSFVVEHLLILKEEHALPEKQIEAYILQQIPPNAKAAYTNEVAWLLFWAKHASIKIPNHVLDDVVKLRSSVIALLIIDLERDGLVEGAIDTTFWKSFCSVDGLKSEMWLIAYEAAVTQLWKGKSSGYVSGHPFFGDLLANDVHFYHPKIGARKKVISPFKLMNFASSMTGVSAYPF